MSWATKLPKPAFFALCGALGCFVGAIFGEVLLAMTHKPPPPPPPPSPPMAICLLIDCSRSMKGSKLAEAKRAAVNFVQRQDLARHRLSLVSFEGSPHRMSDLSQSATDLTMAADRIADGGSTRMDLGLVEAADTLRGASEQQIILLFTDGMPDNQTDTLSAATNVKAAGIKVVAVATDDADVGYLASVTGDKALVFYTSSGQYEQGFLRAEQAIFHRQLLETSTGAYSYREALARVAGWTAWLALGAGLALGLGQFLLVKRRSFPLVQIGKIAIGATIAGFLAGGVGQVLYSAVSFLPSADVAVRVVAWALLGAVLGRGMALIVPNLEPKKATLGGALGAFVGVLAFLFMSRTIGDSPGRLAGAVLLGAALGVCVGIVEVLFREAWLTVAYGPKELVTVTLGREPVKVGSHASSTVYVAGDADLEYVLDQGRLTCLDRATGKSEVPTPGAWKKVGNVAVAVNTAETRADPSGLDGFWPAASFPPPAASGKIGDSSSVPESSGQVTTGSLVLCLDNGKEMTLKVGVTIFGSDLGEAGAGSAQAVAQVQGHPAKKDTLGLVNLSTTAWTVTNSQGDRTSIPQGMTITLKDGLVIAFASRSGVVRLRA
jgi:Ca-activated chloride channel family protein